MKQSEVVRWLNETKDNFGDDMWEIQKDALDTAIKCVELMPELVNEIKKYRHYDSYDCSHCLEVSELLKKAKELME